MCFSLVTVGGGGNSGTSWHSSLSKPSAYHSTVAATTQNKGYIHGRTDWTTK